MNDLGQFSLLAIYGAMAAYAVAMVAFGIDLSALRDGGPSGRPRRAAAIAMTTTTAGLAMHGAGLVTRGFAAGRVPWANMYEFTLVFTFVAIATFLLIQRWRDLRYLGALVITPALLALGLAVAVFYIEADGVRPALDHYWLVLHVSVATMAMGVFAVAAALSVLQLLKSRRETPRTPTPSAERTPIPSAERTPTPSAESSPTPSAESAVFAESAVSAHRTAAATSTAPAPTPTSAESAPAPTSPSTESAVLDGAGGRKARGFWGRLADVLPGSVELERLAYRLNAVGFLLWTFTLIAGAIWAEHAWGRPWDWDPKEVGTFVVWVVYAAYLHARATRGWDGRKAAYLGLTGFGLILVNYYVVNLFTDTVHGYAF